MWFTSPTDQSKSLSTSVELLLLETSDSLDSFSSVRRLEYSNVTENTTEVAAWGLICRPVGAALSKLLARSMLE